MANVKKPTVQNSLYSKFDSVFTLRRVATCAQQAIPYFKPGMKILDVGCGHGSITIDMAQNYAPDSKIQALDKNEAWLDTARKLAEQAGVSNIEWMAGDACDLSRFADEEFDIVHAHQVLLHVLQPVQALREMRRVCKTGGIVTIRDSVGAFWLPTMPELDRCLDLAMQASVKQGASGYGGRFSVEWAHQAGFAPDRVDMSAVGWEYSDPDGRRLWYEGRGGMINGAIQAGLATENERPKFEAAWKQWVDSPTARLLGLDTALVCHK